MESKKIFLSKRGKGLLIGLFCVCFVLSGLTTVRAETTDSAQKTETTDETKKTEKIKSGLIKEGAEYKYYVKNKVIKNQWKKIKGFYYYFKSNGAAARNGSFKIKKSYYVFDKNARRLVLKKDGVKKVNGKYYFVTKTGKAYSKGWHKLGSKYYYVKNAKGEVAVNTTVQGIKVTKSGTATISNKVACKIAAANFIKNHTKSSDSKAVKLRKCFNYIMAYTNFAPRMSPTKAEFESKTWIYTYALKMFRTGLTGNCYGISSCFAAIAWELGYAPYVVAMPEGHSIVMINGLIYDNMYGTIYGGTSRPGGVHVYQKIKF